ncbi:porin, partial [Psittacicella gerlachiana]
MKKTLLALTLAAATLFTANSAQAYTLYSDDNTNLRVYGYAFYYRLLNEQAGGFNASGTNSLTKTDYFQFRTQVLYTKKLDDKVSVRAFARFRYIKSWRYAYTRTLQSNGSHTTTENKSITERKFLHNDRLYLTLSHSDYGSVTVGKNISFLAGESWSGGYPAVLGVYDAAWNSNTLGGFVTDKSFKFSSKTFNGKHSFALAYDQNNSGNYNAYGVGYYYNFANDGGTLYAVGSLGVAKNKYKVSNPTSALDEQAVEVGYYGDLGKYSHVAYFQASHNKSYDKTAANKVFALAYSGSYSFGKLSTYFSSALTRENTKASGVTTRNFYAGAVVGVGYTFWRKDAFRVQGNL